MPARIGQTKPKLVDREGPGSRGFGLGFQPRYSIAKVFDLIFVTIDRILDVPGEHDHLPGQVFQGRLDELESGIRHIDSVGQSLAERDQLSP